MMEVLSGPSAGPSQPQDIPGRSSHQAPASAQLSLNPSALHSTPNDHPRTSRITDLRLDTLLVNENGSFEFDRVVKSGMVRKRTRKTKTWKKVYIVLRPNLLSIYRNEQEDQLRHQIHLADLTAVAYLKDPKREHVFGLFTPARNYHLEASSEADALEWVALIRREARIEEAEAELSLISPGGHSGAAYRGFGRQDSYRHVQSGVGMGGDGHYGSSSGDAGVGVGGGAGSYGQSLTTTRDGIRIPPMEAGFGRMSPTEHVGAEMGSYSDFSDGIGSAGGFRDSSLSLSMSEPREGLDAEHVVASTKKTAGEGHAPASASASAPPQQKQQATDSPLRRSNDTERVMWHGYLWLLKSKGGVRQWKRFWAVLRPQKLAFYKSDEEYSTLKLILVTQMLDAVEIDPLSKSRQYCMQIIINDDHQHKTKTYRFCCVDERGLETLLGGLKSLVVRERVERDRERLEREKERLEREKEKSNK